MMAEDMDQSSVTHLKRWEKIVYFPILIVSIIIFVIICVYFGWTIIWDDTSWCSNEFSETFYSPDNKYKAVSFLRNCGATEGYKPGVSILLAEDEFNATEKANVFLCYRCGCTNVSWQSDRELLIEYCWPTGTGLKFESSDEFLEIQENNIYDVKILLRLIQQD